MTADPYPMLPFPPPARPTPTDDKEEKALPLPGWLLRVYFIFPIVIYLPDMLFNFYVYSDGLTAASQNGVVQVGQIVLWAFLSVGVVGMAWLLSVLAPWHWMQGHHIQAFFCIVGVVIATAITVWNSLAYRSTVFHAFPTDQWAYPTFPQLAAQHISMTMILVALAPPFWGLFWALVQPTTNRRSLASLQEGHAEKLLRVQHEAELKRLRAESNAKVREAQLKGMAQTAAAARAQAGTLFTRKPSVDLPAPPSPRMASAIAVQDDLLHASSAGGPPALPAAPPPRRRRGAPDTPVSLARGDMTHVHDPSSDITQLLG